LNRDWPSGRGIFHNEAKTFLVWVNEEDQLRIISMQKGAGISEVFDRLCRAATAIEKIAKFSHDGHLGYITSCPTNLGITFKSEVSTESTLSLMTEPTISPTREDSVCPRLLSFKI
jgi:arginine kinase